MPLLIQDKVGAVPLPWSVDVTSLCGGCEAAQLNVLDEPLA